MGLWIPCSLSPFSTRVHSSLLLDSKRTVASKFFDTQLPLLFSENVVLPRHARYDLSRLGCNEHRLLLNSHLSRIDKIKNPSQSACGHLTQFSCHSALSTNKLFVSFALWRLFLSLRRLVQILESCPVLEAP